RADDRWRASTHPACLNYTVADPLCLFRATVPEMRRESGNSFILVVVPRIAIVSGPRAARFPEHQPDAQARASLASTLACASGWWRGNRGHGCLPPQLCLGLLDDLAYDRFQVVCRLKIDRFPQPAQVRDSRANVFESDVVSLGVALKLDGQAGFDCCRDAFSQLQNGYRHVA